MGKPPSKDKDKAVERHVPHVHYWDDTDRYDWNGRRVMHCRICDEDRIAGWPTTPIVYGVWGTGKKP
jgi:hypothetical protein